MARVGIVTCGNCTGELNCSSVSCLRDLRKREGAFERYKDEQSLDLIGIISCAGCPTVGAQEKILKRVRALVEFRVEAIHFTFCMVALCPFKKVYAEVIKKAYPQVEVVFGTHVSRVTDREFQQEVKELLCAPRRAMPDLILGRPKHE